MVSLNSLQKQRTEQIINFFEYGTLNIDYKTAENINDGRGITAGRAGFTSATGDMLIVVDRYTQKKPINPLARYLPRLRELARQSSGATTGLEGLEQAWATAANDQVFKDVQDAVVNEIYYLPARTAANLQGVKLPFSLAVIYDTIIQHGGGDDPDGLDALIGKTNAEMGGTPAQGIDEKAWLTRFLEIRREHLENAFDISTRDAWRESVGRCEILAAIADSGDYNLSNPIQLSPDGHFVVKLVSNIANLTLSPGSTYSYETDINGNSLNNILTGNIKSNVLYGQQGNDKLQGLDGDDLLFGGTGVDQIIGGKGIDDVAGGPGNDLIDLGQNRVQDNAEDTIIYDFGGGSDTVNFFQRVGIHPDFLLFENINAIDVVTKSNRTEFRLSDGVRGNSGFAQGSLLIILNSVQGFTVNNIANNLTEGNATQFLFS